MQNSSRIAGKTGWDSGNHMAGVGNKNHKYIQEIASATIADKEKKPNLLPTSANCQWQRTPKLTASQFKSSYSPTQLYLSQSHSQKKRTTVEVVMPVVATALTAVVVEVRCNFGYPCNMGSYCWSHGHHPVRAKHDSIMCTHKKGGHKDDATFITAWAGTTSGHKPTRSCPLSKTTAATKESQPPIDRGWGWISTKTTTK
jgi:hypothetical protein